MARYARRRILIARPARDCQGNRGRLRGHPPARADLALCRAAAALDCARSMDETADEEAIRSACRLCRPFIVEYLEVASREETASQLPDAVFIPPPGPAGAKGRPLSGMGASRIRRASAGVLSGGMPMSPSPPSRQATRRFTQVRGRCHSSGRRHAFEGGVGRGGGARAGGGGRGGITVAPGPSADRRRAGLRRHGGAAGAGA